MYKYVKYEFNEAQLELNTVSHIAESFFSPASSLENLRNRRSMEEDELHKRTRRLIDAVAALAAGTGFISVEPIKDAACNALSIFNFCNSTEDLERGPDEVTKQQATQQAFQAVRKQNKQELALLRDEVRLTQERVERIADTYTDISHMLGHIHTLEDAFRCYQLESGYSHFLQTSQVTNWSTLYTF